MGMLTEEALGPLVAAGCPDCGARGSRLIFRTFVDGLVPLLAGEPVGKLAWVYDGERFVDGVYEVKCGECWRVLFHAEVCPRCHKEGALAAALASTNAWPVPTACRSCDGEEVRYIALLPATVTYEGKRAGKARTSTEIGDPGFHAYRVDCKDCGGMVDEEVDKCPLCATPAPLRARPGG